MDEYILEAFDTVLKEFEMLEQTLNIKNSTVTKHRKRMEKQVKINSSMATKLNEIDNQLRECRKIMTKINSGEESEAITHTTCNCQTQQMHLVGDGKAKISDCTCCIKRFDQKVTSWLRNVKTRSFDLQKERSQLQKALEYAEIGLPIDTRTVMDFPLQPATHHAVLRSHFIKFPEIKRKHTRLCETELELQKYKSITEKCKQISQQCKVFSESYTKTSKQQFRSIPSTGAGGILQSTSYRQAIMKAQVPFMHHYILECNHNGLEYTFEDHDITLIIPEGAVAKDQTIHIEFDATMCGPFIFPENTRPISPIVWLCLLEKDAKLKKPFQLILQHFLTGLIKEEFQQYQIGFMKANHHKSTVEGGDMTYVFSPSNSKPLFASRGNKSYAVLESDHCCFYCLEAHITPDLARDAGYCLTQIERPLSRRRHEVYFVATYCLDTCIQVKWLNIIICIITITIFMS